MVAPRGNQFWKLAKAYGRTKIYTPDALWEKAIEYFDWVDKNPLKAEKVFSSGVKMQEARLRAMTLRGFCLYAGIGSQTFRDYETLEEFSGITARIRDFIYVQKFEGASAGLLESNIIARELGLADKQDVSVGGKDISESKLNELTIEQLLAIEKIMG